MNLRILKPSDYSAWEALWLAYQQFYQVQLSAEVNQTTFARLLDPHEKMGCLVMENATGRLVAFTHYLYHRSAWSISNNCYLQDLYVQPEQRKKGLATQLIQAVYEEAKKEQCAKVYWLTHESNLEAQSLYNQVAEKSGFIQYRQNL